MKEENIKSEYQRKVDKSLIPTCNIMGVNIAAINMNWLLKYIDENLSDIKGDYICVSNVHTTVTSYEDEKVKRVSYSTSFGVTEVPFYQKRRTIEYLNRIEMLGVREKSGAELIERLTGRRAVVVLDPTLLLNKEEWAQAIPVKPVLENDYIFCYFLGANSEHRKVAEELSKKTGIPLYDMPHNVL